MASSRYEMNINRHADKLTPQNDKQLLLESPVVLKTQEKCSTLKENRQKTCATRRICVAILTISMVINLILGCVLLYGYASAKKKDDGHDDVISGDLSTSICMSCDSLNVPDSEIAPFGSNVRVKVIEQNLCCLQHSEHLQTLLNIMLSEHYHFNVRGDNPETYQLDLTTPSAHLYLQSPSRPAEHLEWDPNLGLGTAHMSGGVLYSNGSIRVPADGIYFLYSHITIAHEQSGHDLHLDNDLIHCVKRSNPNLSRVGDQLLLFNKMSMGKENKRTSYLGANLRLRRGDEVFVKFSDQSIIYDFTPANFFGLYLLK